MIIIETIVQISNFFALDLQHLNRLPFNDLGSIFFCMMSVVFIYKTLLLICFIEIKVIFLGFKSITAIFSKEHYISNKNSLDFFPKFTISYIKWKICQNLSKIKNFNI